MKIFVSCLLGLGLGLMGCVDDDATFKADASTADASTAEPDEPKKDWDDDKASALFDKDAFETFDLEISKDNLATLDADPTAEKYVEGSMTYAGKKYPAAIRYKGSIGAWHRGSMRCVGTGSFSTMPTGPKTCQKLGLKVSFNEYDATGRFMGMRKVLFHSLNQDTSLMRERLAYEIFRDMGIPAPRASHARVLINGKFQGVYAFIEYIDGELVRSRFNGGHGNLYKEAWPAGSDLFVPNTKESLQAALRTNEADKPSFKGFLDFNDDLMAAKGDDAQLDVVSKRMDTDYMLRYIAADRATEHNDGILHFYPSDNNEAPWSNHNFFVYESEKEEQLWVIPWDMDNAWNPDNAITHINQAWNDKAAGCKESIVEGFGINQIPPSCSPVIRAFAHDDLKDAFKGYVEDLLDGPLSEKVIDAKIEKWSALIADSVEEASAFEGELSVDGWETGKRQLRSAIETTRNNLRALIGRKVEEAAAISMNGYVTWPQDPSQPIEGVKVCLYGHKDVPCVMTDDTGAYSLPGVPPSSEQVLTFDQDGLVPVARNYNVPTAEYTEMIMDATGMWPADGDSAPFVEQPENGKGSVILFPYGNSAGHTLTISPKPDATIEYFAESTSVDEPPRFDPKLKETSAAGVAVLQNLEPGEYHAMFDKCMGFKAVQWGLPAKDGTSAVRFRVVAGYVLNTIVQICP